ncbi:endonuclease Q family protein, partial [Blautia wexlerae]|nr:endonuclease Q family protein [Blautia wexlerae]
LDSHDLLEMMVDVCPEGILIPAHIWTPLFSVLGAKSGFDSVEEFFEELTPFVHALETGLSSDPAMNWRISILD